MNKLSSKEHKRLSKFLSLILRHKPETINIKLDENGWADITSLIDLSVPNGYNYTLEILEDIVANNDKKRFTFNDNKTKIRANQGHSIKVDLDLKPIAPPEVLFHGTGEKFVESIEQTGLLKQNRQHVHLSLDKATAISVGRRHGKPALFRVNSSDMQKEGYKFYLSKNKVWLTDKVPTNFLARTEVKKNEG